MNLTLRMRWRLQRMRQLVAIMKDVADAMEQSQDGVTERMLEEFDEINGHLMAASVVADALMGGEL